MSGNDRLGTRRESSAPLPTAPARQAPRRGRSLGTSHQPAGPHGPMIRQRIPGSPQTSHAPGPEPTLSPGDQMDQTDGAHGGDPRGPSQAPATFEQLVTKKLSMMTALRENSDRVPNDMPPVVLARRLQAIVPQLLRQRFGSSDRATKLIALAASYGTPTEVDVALVRLIAIWQLASGKKVDGWLGGPSYELLGRQEANEKDAAKAHVREKSERTLDHRALARIAAASKNQALQQLVARIDELGKSMETLEGTTNGEKTMERTAGGLVNIQDRHQFYRRHKEISESEREQFRRFIADARPQIAALTTTSTGLEGERLAQLKAKLFRHLNALSPYYSQMAAGKAINKIFNPGKNSKSYWKITCHIHSMAMAFEGMGKSARDFQGDWGRLVEIAKAIDATRYSSQQALEALRLPEFLMLVSVYQHADGNPSSVTSEMRLDAYGPNYFELSSYFGIKATWYEKENKKHRSSKSPTPAKRNKEALLATLGPLVQSGVQVTVLRMPNMHWVRLEHLDQDRVIFDNPAQPGKNQELSWDAALKQGYFTEYTTFRETQRGEEYWAAIPGFNVSSAVRHQKRALAKYDATPAGFATRIIAAIRRDLPKYHRRRQVEPLLNELGCPTVVDAKLVRLVAIYQRVVLGSSASGTDGYLDATIAKLGFSRRARRSRRR